MWATLTAVNLVLAPALVLPAVVLHAAEATPDPAILLAQNRSGAAELSVRFGRHEEYDRLVFAWSKPVAFKTSRSGEELVVTFEEADEVALPPEGDFAYLADRLPQLVFGLRAEDGGRRYRIRMDEDARLRIHRWNDGRLIAVDIFQPAPAGAPGADPEPVAKPERRPAPTEEAGDVGLEEGDDGPDALLPVEPVESASDEDGDTIVEDDEESAATIDDEDDDDDVDSDDEDEDEDEEVEEDDWAEALGGSDVFGLYIGATLQFGVSTAAGDRLSDDGDSGYAFFADTDIEIGAYTTVLDEVDVGASLTLDANAGGDDTVNADDAYIYLDNGFGLFQLGRTSGAEDDMALSAATIAPGTGGIDGDTANLGQVEIETSGDAAKISYFTPRIGGVQFGASYTPDLGDAEDENDRVIDLENYVGLGLNFVRTFGETELSLATVASFAESEFSDADDLKAYAVGGTLALDQVQLGASYGHSASDFFFDNDFATLGVTVGVGEGEAGLGYNFVDEKSAGITHIFVLSGDTPILPNVELQGDVSYADPEGEDGNVASVLAIELGF